MKRREFKPKPGQIDFTEARWTPVINCIVKFKDRFDKLPAGKILIVKRSRELHLYPGKWNSIGGFLDDAKSLEEKVKEELSEELGIHEQDIASIRLGEIFDLDDPNYKKTWVIHPVLVEVKSDKIRLDWEAEEYKWVTLAEIKNFDTVFGFDKVVDKLFFAQNTPRLAAGMPPPPGSRLQK